MTLQQKFLVVALISTACALGLAIRLPPASHERRCGVHGSLASMIVALLLVGIVSDTFLRQAIQIGPLVLALGVGALRPRLRVAAALPLFTLWLFIMSGIWIGGLWLILLGIAPSFTGRFSPINMTLTILIGLASITGLINVFQEGTALGMSPRVGILLLFAALQPAAMIISF